MAATLGAISKTSLANGRTNRTHFYACTQSALRDEISVHFSGAMAERAGFETAEKQAVYELSGDSRPFDQVMSSASDGSNAAKYANAREVDQHLGQTDADLESKSLSKKSVRDHPMSGEDALRLAIKLAVDEGDYERATALLAVAAKVR